MQLPVTSDAIASLGTCFGSGSRCKSRVMCREQEPFMSSQVSRGLLGSQGWLGAPEGSSKAFSGPMKLAFPPSEGSMRERRLHGAASPYLTFSGVPSIQVSARACAGEDPGALITPCKMHNSAVVPSSSHLGRDLCM